MDASLRLSELSRGRDNNLNLLRFIAAMAVVYAHAFGILNRSGDEPFYRLMHRGLGDLGVDLFFVVSGFLVTKSLEGKQSIGAFAWARVMRVFPALWISTFFWVAVVGIFFSDLPTLQFWKQGSTLSYLFKNFTMLPGLGAQLTLPHTRLMGPEFNAPLWTLPHELQMYALLAILGLVGMLRYRWLVVALAALGIAALIIEHFHLDLGLGTSRARFVYFFFAGAGCYLFRDVILLRGSVSLGLVATVGMVCVLSQSAELRQLTLALATPYLTFWLAYVPSGAIRRFNAAGDYSYGIYILAFPLQLLIATYLPILHPLQFFLISMAAVLPLAFIPWHLLEQRFLRKSPPGWILRLLPLPTTSFPRVVLPVRTV